ncbi:hypothetical protein GGF32_007141 [Allomyces javanicus]|nr:hypothetical protein GGF32_007141 [Allomyces javanicus]
MPSANALEPAAPSRPVCADAWKTEIRDWFLSLTSEQLDVFRSLYINNKEHNPVERRGRATKIARRNKYDSVFTFVPDYLVDRDGHPGSGFLPHGHFKLCVHCWYKGCREPRHIFCSVLDGHTNDMIEHFKRMHCDDPLVLSAFPQLFHPLPAQRDRAANDNDDSMPCATLFDPAELHRRAVDVEIARCLGLSFFDEWVPDGLVPLDYCGRTERREVPEKQPRRIINSLKDIDSARDAAALCARVALPLLLKHLDRVGPLALAAVLLDPNFGVPFFLGKPEQIGAGYVRKHIHGVRALLDQLFQTTGRTEPVAPLAAQEAHSTSSRRAQAATERAEFLLQALSRDGFGHTEASKKATRAALAQFGLAELHGLPDTMYFVKSHLYCSHGTRSAGGSAHPWIMDPIDLWNGPLGDEFPELKPIAVQVLMIPASTSQVERFFSVAGLVASAPRSSMAAETIAESCAVRAWQREFGSLNRDYAENEGRNG